MREAVPLEEGEKEEEGEEKRKEREKEESVSVTSNAGVSSLFQLKRGTTVLEEFQGQGSSSTSRQGQIEVSKQELDIFLLFQFITQGIS